MKVLYVGSHSILEYDEVRLLHSLGLDVFSIGAYTDPANPSDDKRPPLPEVPYHPELDALCVAQREKHAGEDMRFYIDFAKSDLHPDLVDWADLMIFAAFPEAWIVPQWRKISHKRVIWRTIGQSDTSIEQYVSTISGLEIVRYSPAEKRAFEKLGVFAGEDAMIRFAKNPSDWYGWTGDDPVVGNVTQDMAGRGEACGYSFWLNATKGLATKPAGPNSQALPGGIGSLSYEDLRAYLRGIRAYLYTGTQPASYTLGLIEAMLTGVPVVAMGAEHVGYPPLYEASEIVGFGADDPSIVHKYLSDLLADVPLADTGEPILSYMAGKQRTRAIELFAYEHVAPQWAQFLGVRALVAA